MLPAFLWVSGASVDGVLSNTVVGPKPLVLPILICAFSVRITVQIKDRADGIAHGLSTQLLVGVALQSQKTVFSWHAD